MLNRGADRDIMNDSDLLRETLNENGDKYIRYLSELVAEDTRVIGFGIDGGNEKNGQEYLQALFREMGADEIAVDQMDEKVISAAIAEHNEGNPGHVYDQRYNLYATFRGGAGRSILFNGHVDTMPYGEAGAWNHPPLTPVIEDGKLYGLGACDMKGGLMASILAVKLLQEAGIGLPGDVHFTSVVDEEGGGNGSIQAAMNGRKADAVVVCEPTDNELILAHMGFVFYRVEIDGKSNHSGSKWLGVSAIEKAVKLINALQEIEEKWSETYSHDLLPPPSLNVGIIEGGTAASTVAGFCSFDVCIHYLPALMSEQEVENVFNEAVEKISSGDEWLEKHPVRVERFQAGGSFEMDETHALVDNFRQAYKDVRGKDAPVVGSPAGCDSRIWKNIAGCPTIQYGPGRLEQCHAVNEYLSIDSYLETILIYANLILQWCK